MKPLSILKIQKFEQHTIEKIGVPAEVLMERAALAVTETTVIFLASGIKTIKKLAKNGIYKKFINQRKSLKNKKILIFCGKGNNGGDGLAAARQLHQLGAKIIIYLVFEQNEYKNTSKLQLSIAQNLKLKIKNLQETKGIKKDLASADLIIDAVFGTGFSGSVVDPLASLFQKINSAQKPVLAVDIPSGINGATGECESIALKAFLTVTFQYPKIGLLKSQGKKHSGIILVWDIGLIDRM